MANDINHKGPLSELCFVILVIVGGVLPFVLYFCCPILLWAISLRRREQVPEEIQLEAIYVSNKNSGSGLIPSHKHKKVMGSVDGEPMCAVCLSEFEDGEELRTMPECMHSFHAPCIDMWLYSHRSCPICRLDATSMAPPSVDVICVDGQQPQQEEVTRP
ncbi:uncharacterized protein LOC143637592 [Bidens hawaiensis]|uniref:uncharacterized protein LOC143637592 n=1 Tax=Bidens hawaiensis TaxID=980011 RepID=UPI0040493C1F